jgi:myo-inositol-1(or 4)-monophosphatase
VLKLDCYSPAWRSENQRRREEIELDLLLRTARAAADAAAAIHRQDAGRVLVGDASMKSRANYVSQTDLAAQRAVISVIEEHHPGHLILAEESDESVQDQLARWDGRPLWIVDPLDGTTNFLHNHPHYCASIAVAVDGRPVVGAVTSAPGGERWWAAEGIGAFKNGKPISVSKERRLIHSMVGTGFPFKLLDVLPEYLEEFDRVLRATSGIRRGGSAALDLCYLAQGSLDAFWEKILMPWDFAAGLVLVREAGGALARPDGSELGLHPGPLYGANSLELLEALSSVLEG